MVVESVWMEGENYINFCLRNHNIFTKIPSLVTRPEHRLKSLDSRATSFHTDPKTKCIF